MSNEKKKTKITGTMMLRWIGILTLIVISISWIIAGVREGEIIPVFIREQWWFYVFSSVLCVGSITSSKKPKDENIK